MCLFQILQQSLKFDLQCFLKDKNNVFERKACCSLSKKNSHYTNERAENQIIKNQAITTQSTLSMKAKIKSKPIVFSMQTKMFFQTNKQMRKTKQT
jgi:hypothetical protein